MASNPLIVIARTMGEVAGAPVAESWGLTYTSRYVTLVRGYEVEDCVFRDLDEACAYARSATQEAA